MTKRGIFLRDVITNRKLRKLSMKCLKKNMNSGHKLAINLKKMRISKRKEKQL